MAWPTASWSSDNVPSMDGALRVGFLGGGLIATFHSKMLRNSPLPIVRAGVYDVDPHRAAAFAAASGCEVAASEAALLDASDAVYVCTWTSEHRGQVDAAAARGLHVFCEKPLAVDLATAQSMLATVTSAGITHQVGLVLRRSPAFLMARELVRDPAAGAVMAVVFRDDQFIPVQGHYGSTWRSDRRLAGSGTLLEHSIHDVDLLRMIVGDIESVSADQQNHHGHEGIEDVVVASVRFRSGALGTLTTVWHDNLARPSLRRVEVFCERRHVVVDGHDWFGPVTWTDADGTTTSLVGEALVAEAAAIADDGLDPDASFVAAATEHRPAMPDFAVAVEAHRVVDAMYRSAAAGGHRMELSAT
jgi:predicted dehydrogenase